MNTLRRKLVNGLGMSYLASPAVAALAAVPRGPVHIVVAGGTGGVIDIRARWLAGRLSTSLAQPVIVDNRPGAGGNIGTEYVAHSPADGRTLLFVHQGTMAINPHLYPHLGYDPLTDFAPITRLGVGPLVLTVNVDVPARSVADLVRLAKARPGELTYGSPGIGTPPHLASELFERAAGIQATHVPYKGGGALMTDLLGGHLTWSMDGLNSQLPYVKAGRLRALAVTGSQRLQALPDTPTVADGGVAGYEYVSWSGLAAPAATPKGVIARLYEDVVAIAASAESQEFFSAFGLEAGTESPDEFAALIRSEYTKWGKVIRDAGIRLE